MQLVAVSWGLSHAVTIFFPGDFLIELGPGYKPAQQDRVEFGIGIERRRQHEVSRKYSSIFGCGRCELNTYLSEGLDCFCMQRMVGFLWLAFI